MFQGRLCRPIDAIFHLVGPRRRTATFIQRSFHYGHLWYKILVGLWNRHFQRPTRIEFQTQMRDTLRVAKERYRSRMRGPRARRVGAPRINRDFWEEEEERGGEGNPEELDNE